MDRKQDGSYPITERLGNAVQPEHRIRAAKPPTTEGVPTMGKKARKKKARKGSKANHGKRPNA
ncbi:hypothetical protein GCM10009662_72110 [Catellatospora coxensis]|uniref:Uncharacterized protein n=2 Tax=Catellatospora TaxID=53365 RepID=A0A8J3LBA0_9ACTN|nr:hypothetical protein Cco03nite_81550 [Catellatospora coxensis]